MAVDFDGDRVGRNNEESLRGGQHALLPTLYFAYVETTTQRFISYFAFHPLDWEPVDDVLRVGLWHENDGESVQLVVDKATERVEAIVAQAHLGSIFSRRDGSSLFPRQWEVAAEPIVFDGERPVIFIESGGHGIWSLAARPALLAEWRRRRIDAGRRGEFLLMRPRTDRGAASELPAFTAGQFTYDYRLIDMSTTLWAWARSGRDCGDGRLYDGTFNFIGEHVRVQQVPRHFDSDRLSIAATGKCDSGIAPFAFSHHLAARDLGALFFEPAEKYRRDAVGTESWSTEYLWRYPPVEPAEKAADANRTGIGERGRK